MKPEILFLCHRIPYPADKGDKIRTHNVLRFLAKHYRVHLGTFVDSPADLQYVEMLKPLTESCKVVSTGRLTALYRYAKGIIFNSSLTVAYYEDDNMKSWVQQLLDSSPIEACIVSSSGMASYLIPSTAFRQQKRLIDFIDIDSDKWSQYASKSRMLFRWVYEREARMLSELERRICLEFDHCFFVSKAEAEAFAKIHADCKVNVDYFCNGVDLVYFDGKRTASSADNRTIVFTGVMDYWPNIEAVVFFAQNILPRLQHKDPRWTFVIVGSNPSRAVRQLDAQSGVQVTGRVPDVRPYLASAVAAVAPMTIARGVQNKVLEAMAMRTPVVASSQAIEGISAKHGVDVLIANSEAEYVDHLESIAAGNGKAMGDSSRIFVEKHFSWEYNLSRLHSALLANVQDITQ